MITVSVIIVNWNVRDLLRRALTSVYASWDGRPGPEIIVVDNASHDGSVAMLRDAFPQVSVIANAENRGFTGGNNQGLAAATGDFLLLLNPDTEIVGDALPRMVEYLQSHADVGMVGPQLLNPDNSVQSSRRHFPTLPVLFLESTWLEKFAPRKMLRYYYAQERPDDAIQEVDWVTGAAMLTRREVVNQVGGMDESFFMYSEELDWCRRIHDAGWRVVYFPEARVIHYEGQSSAQVVPARHIYFQASKIRYTQKYHGNVIAEGLRLWLLAQYAWQIGVEGAKWLVGHRRDLRAARIAAYRQVLSSKLRIANGEWQMANGE
ncbi:MAG TPA: glycosyltransferase family 2 protein [Anaerolineae bacterium]|nr:glycosyltransferase family 2 protein [Anaerolineae bacterium]HQH38923.1 glycosyltransferase family 2 protein [Anaerolineae bacterium]